MSEEYINRISIPKDAKERTKNENTANQPKGQKKKKKRPNAQASTEKVRLSTPSASPTLARRVPSTTALPSPIVTTLHLRSRRVPVSGA